MFNPFDFRSPIVRITGFNADSRAVEFDVRLSLASGKAEFRTRSYGVAERLVLLIEAVFRVGKSVSTSATVTGFTGVVVERTGETALTTYVEHSKETHQSSLETDEQCRLVCFENGQTNTGPCLTCPDGEYQVRVCC
jgi:hypothetical protein